MAGHAHQLTIGQMAALNHVSTETLRHYDRAGLLTPAAVDPDTGYRWYSIRQCARLDMIRHLQLLGLTLAEIRSHIENGDTAQVITQLERRLGEIDHEFRDLAEQQRAIRRMIESIRRYESAPPDGRVVLEYIPERPIHVLATDFDFYRGGIEAYERMLRQLRDHLRGMGLSEAGLANPGTLLRLADLRERRFRSTEIFVFLDTEEARTAATERLPAGTWSSIYCNRFDDEIPYANMLLDAIAADGLSITGDYICEVLFEPPVASSAAREMLMRLQVPVTFAEAGGDFAQN
ncbi:MAG: MerR family transcriptional regulator [Bacillota bacterium]|nr:MerR family transcriptional regulator [Bacillota bacterium]